MIRWQIKNTFIDVFRCNQHVFLCHFFAHLWLFSWSVNFSQTTIHSVFSRQKSPLKIFQFSKYSKAKLTALMSDQNQDAQTLEVSEPMQLENMRTPVRNMTSSTRIISTPKTPMDVSEVAQSPLQRSVSKAQGLVRLFEQKMNTPVKNMTPIRSLKMTPDCMDVSPRILARLDTSSFNTPSIEDPVTKKVI